MSISAESCRDLSPERLTELAAQIKHRGLELGFEQLFTPGLNLVATSYRPMWAVFYQCLGPYAWGGNVWQHPDSGIPARVILPPVHR